MIQEVRFITGIVFCLLYYRTGDKGVPFVTRLIFCILLFHTRDGRHDFLRALGSASCSVPYETGDTICNEHWGLHLVLSHTRKGLRLITGIGWGILCYHAREKRVRCLTGLIFCIMWYHTRDGRYDLFQALGSVSCVVSYETGDTIYNGHSGLYLVLSHTRKGLRLITGSGCGILCYHAREKSVWFITGLIFCILWYHTRDGRYDLLRALGSASCLVIYETGDTICNGHSGLNLVLSYTRHREKICCRHWFLYLVLSRVGQWIQFVSGIKLYILNRQRHWFLRLVLPNRRHWIRFVAGIGHCIFSCHTQDRRYDLSSALGAASWLMTMKQKDTIC